MEEDKFQSNLLRVIAAELHFANMMRAAQEKYGVSVLNLEGDRLQEVYKSVAVHIEGLYRVLTPAFLENQGSMADFLSRIPPSGRTQ